MAKQQVKLFIEISTPEIYYYWDYDPKIRNIGGGCSVIWPGQVQHRFKYNDFYTLGNGWHSVVFDTDWEKFQKPTYANEDDRLFYRAKFYLFRDRMGQESRSSALGELVLSFTPNNASRIMFLLSEDQVNHMKKFAAGISPNQAERNGFGYALYSSNGSCEYYPDDNLIAIIESFPLKDEEFMDKELKEFANHCFLHLLTIIRVELTNNGYTELPEKQDHLSRFGSRKINFTDGSNTIGLSWDGVNKYFGLTIDSSNCTHFLACIDFDPVNNSFETIEQFVDKCKDGILNRQKTLDRWSKYGL